MIQHHGFDLRSVDRALPRAVRHRTVPRTARLLHTRSMCSSPTGTCANESPARSRSGASEEARLDRSAAIGGPDFSSALERRLLDEPGLSGNFIASEP
eukprot:scaffold238958_cov30-Tisochrysis_lutea.AAC.2